jgi:hypothetical protein
MGNNRPNRSPKFQVRHINISNCNLLTINNSTVPLWVPISTNPDQALIDSQLHCPYPRGIDHVILS